MRILIALILCIVLSGCWIYGEGSTVGYITTVEDGIFWNTVWIRADVSSSQTNGYAIRKGERDLRKQLLKIAEEHKKVELYFKKHIGMARMGDDVLTDEIIDYKIIE